MSGLNLVGLAGKAGAGKSTVAKMLVKHHGFVEVSLADPLKRICRDVFEFSDEQLWGASSKRNEPDTRWPRQIVEIDSEPYPGGALAQTVRIEYLTPRHALQQLGTDWGRACSPDVWVRHAIRTARWLLEPQQGRKICYWPERGLSDDPIDALSESEPACLGVVIPDVRFPNELNAIRAAGGKIWRILRPTSGLEGAAGSHVSEHSLDGFTDADFDCTINNEGGTLDDLRGLVDAAMKAHG